MGIQWKEEDEGRVLEIQASGKIAHDDYERFVPEFERLIKQHGLVSVLFDMTDFHGWTAGAIWDDVKLDLRHFGDIRHLAMVGDKKWEKRMSMFCRPFTKAQVRYYDRSKMDEARNWVRAH